MKLNFEKIRKFLVTYLPIARKIKKNYGNNFWNLGENFLKF